MNLTNDIIIHQNVDGTEFIQFIRLLEFPNLRHCYTLRKNGINVQINDGDKTELINSYKKVANVLDINLEHIVKPHQTHTDKVKNVNSVSDKLEEVDGVITNRKDIILCTTSADCTSLFFYDDVKKVVADIHSGWRGTLKQIGKKAVEKMIKEYRCKPEDIICCIGPHIRKCHFEVEEDVMQLFKDEFQYTGRIDEMIEQSREVDGVQKYNIDTALINKIILQEGGIKKENIIDCGICTVCNSEYFHSYRVDRDLSGRNGAFIGMV